MYNLFLNGAALRHPSAVPVQFFSYPGGSPASKTGSVAMVNASPHDADVSTISPLALVSPNAVAAANGSSAMNASRTSSFAAALRKLAKQAVEPTDTEIRLRSPASHQPATSPRCPPPPMLVSTSRATSHTPPALASAQTHNPESRKSLERSASSVSSSTSEQKYESSLYNERRVGEVHGKSSERDILHRPVTGIDSGRGFQPYRAEEGLRRSGSSQEGYEQSMYPYHPAYLPPPQVGYPPGVFRLDDPLYLGRYAMLRAPFFTMPGAPTMLPPHVLHPALVSGARFPSELLPQPLSIPSTGGRYPPTSERLKMEEEQLRLKEQRERERQLQPEVEQIERERHEERARTREAEHRSEHHAGEQKSRCDPTRVSRYSPIKHSSFLPHDGSRHRVQSMGTYIPLDPLANAAKSHSDSKHSAHDSKHRNILSPYQSWQDHAAIRADEVRSLDLSRRHGKPRASQERLLERAEVQRNSLHGGRSNHLDERLHSSRPVNSQDVLDKDLLSYGEQVSLSSAQDRPSIIAEPYVSSSRASKHLSKKPLESVLRDLPSHLKSDAKQDSTRFNLASYSNGKHDSSRFITATYTDGDRSRFNPAIAVSEAEMQRKDAISSSSHGEMSFIPGVAVGVVVSPERSKLDIEEERLKRKRLAVIDGNEGEEDESEEEERGEKRRTRLLTIVNGPPLKRETSSRKMALFAYLHLGTPSQNEDKMYRKWLKRRRFYREDSLSPLRMDEVHDAPLCLIPSSTNSESLNAESDYLEKVKFLSSLGLELLTPMKRKELDNIRQNIRNFKTLQSHLRKNRTQNGAAICRTERKSPHQVNSAVGSKNKLKRQKPEDESDDSHLQSPQSKRPLLSAIVEYQANGHIAHKLSQKFAHEFHESVLMSTKQALVHKQSARKKDGSDRRTSILQPLVSAHHLASSHTEKVPDPPPHSPPPLLPIAVQARRLDKQNQESRLTRNQFSGDDNMQVNNRTSSPSDQELKARAGTYYRTNTLETITGNNHNDSISVPIEKPNCVSNSETLRPTYRHIASSQSDVIPGQNSLDVQRSGLTVQTGQRSYTCDYPHSSYTWPGAEVVMESYWKHEKERNMELSLLHSSISRLRAQNSQLAIEAEALNTQSSMLLQTKQRFDDDRAHKQTAIDNLKKALCVFVAEKSFRLPTNVQR